MEGKTKSGYKYKFDERILSDWRLIQAISDSESADASVQIKGTTALVDLIFAEDKQRLLDHIAKKNDGFCPVDAVTREVTEIIQSVNALKN